MLSRNFGAAHFLALASATTAVVGLQFDDVKWVVSIVVSMAGSAVALYIFRGKMRAHAELLSRLDKELTRRGFVPDRKIADGPASELPVGNDAKESN